jgi:hypothetical protein
MHHYSHALPLNWRRRHRETLVRRGRRLSLLCPYEEWQQCQCQELNQYHAFVGQRKSSEIVEEGFQVVFLKSQGKRPCRERSPCRVETPL